jgi:hypothetical protein
VMVVEEVELDVVDGAQAGRASLPHVFAFRTRVRTGNILTLLRRCQSR